MADRGSSQELNRFSPNPAAQAYFLLLSPEASEAFYSCLYQGFYAYKMTSSAEEMGEGQRKSGEKNNIGLTENRTLQLDWLNRTEDGCKDKWR